MAQSILCAHVKTRETDANNGDVQMIRGRLGQTVMTATAFASMSCMLASAIMRINQLKSKIRCSGR